MGSFFTSSKLLRATSEKWMTSFRSKISPHVHTYHKIILSKGTREAWRAWEAGTKASNTTAKAFMKNGIFVNRQNLIRRGDHISQGDISVNWIVKFPPAEFKISTDLLIDRCVQRSSFVFLIIKLWFTQLFFAVKNW